MKKGKLRSGLIGCGIAVGCVFLLLMVFVIVGVAGGFDEADTPPSPVGAETAQSTPSPSQTAGCPTQEEKEYFGSGAAAMNPWAEHLLTLQSLMARQNRNDPAWWDEVRATLRGLYAMPVRLREISPVPPSLETIHAGNLEVADAGDKWLKLLEPAIIHQDMSLANVAIGELNEVMDRVGTMVVNHCS